MDHRAVDLSDQVDFPWNPSFCLSATSSPARSTVFHDINPWASTSALIWLARTGPATSRVRSHAIAASVLVCRTSDHQAGSRHRAGTLVTTFYTYPEPRPWITVDSEHGAKAQVRMRLSAGGRWIRTLGPPLRATSDRRSRSSSAACPSGNGRSASVRRLPGRSSRPSSRPSPCRPTAGTCRAGRSRSHAASSRSGSGQFGSGCPCRGRSCKPISMLVLRSAP